MVNFNSYSLIIFMIIIIPSYFANANVDRISITDCISKLPQNPDKDEFYIKKYVDACFVKELKEMQSIFYIIKFNGRQIYYEDNKNNFKTTIAKLYKFLDVMKDRFIEENLFAAYKILQDDSATPEHYILFQQYLLVASEKAMIEKGVGYIIDQYYSGHWEFINKICRYLVNKVFTEKNEVQQFQQHLNNSTEYSNKDFNERLYQYRMTSSITGFQYTWQNIPNDLLIEHYKNLLCIYKNFMDTIENIDSNPTNFLTNDNLMIYLKLIYEEFLFIHEYAELLKTHINFTDGSLLNIKFYFDIAFRIYFTQFIEEYNDTDNEGKINPVSYQKIIDTISNDGILYKRYIFLDTYRHQLHIKKPNFEELNCQPINWIYIDNPTLKLETPNLTNVTENLGQLQKKINSYKHPQLILEYITKNIIHGTVY